MGRSGAGIEEAVGELGVALRDGVSRHPSARQLAAYHREELPPEETEALRDHLALCPECSELLLDLAGFGELAASTEAQHWEERKPAVWGSLRSALAAEPARLPRRVAPRRVVSRRRWLSLAAAAALVLAVGTAVWQTLDLGRTRQRLAATAEQLERAEERIGELERGAAELAPQLVVPSLDLFPPGYRRGGGTEPILEIPRHARIFVLQLHIADAGSHTDYRLRILASGGEEVWSGSGLRRTAGGTFRVALPRTLLPSGRYRLELYGAQEPSSQQLAHYDLMIEER